MDTPTARQHFARDRFAELTGIEIVEVSKGYCRAKLILDDRHLNAANIVQGGVIFTLADLAFAVASNSHGQVALAINASISFLQARSTGVLFATATELVKPKRIGVYDVLVHDDHGELIAKFNGMVYRKNQPLVECTEDRPNTYTEESK